MVGTSIHCGSSDDMILNPIFDVLSAIIYGYWNLLGENRIMLYLKIFKHFLYGGMALQRARDMTAMIYPTIILALFDDKNRQIVTTFSSVLFNTQVKSNRHGGHLSTFINVILDSLMQYNKYIKGVTGEAKMITVTLLQAANLLLLYQTV